MDQWALLNQLFTVVIELDHSGNSLRVSALVRNRFSLCENDRFNFFDAFEFKRPARFKGGVSDALASSGRLFLGYSTEAQLAIRGQIIESDGTEVAAFFVGLPWMAWAQEHYGEGSLQFDDFPAHDSQMDQLLLLSSQQRMLEDLQDLNSELEAAKTAVEGQVDIRQRFFNRVSHEVRTPLMGVSSALTLLRDRVSDAESLNLISMGDASVDRATEVINFALGDAAGQVANNDSLTVATDLRHLIRKVVKLFEAPALQKGLALNSSIDPALAAQYWCPDLILKEALINLVGNAVKFTAKGWVYLEVTLEDDASAEDIHNLIFTVTDSGPGIPSTLRTQIFAPFETGVTEETENLGGTGLGLSSTDAAIKGIGGSIAVGDSRVGGAMFSVRVALRPCSDIKQVEPAELPISSFRFSQRILLLDDSATNLSLNSQLLESLGFEVISAASGSEAIAIAQSSIESFDIALLDINLPDMTGYEVARALSNSTACSEALLIALSAYSEAGEQKKAADVGMTAFITKPFKRDAIASLLAELLDGDNLSEKAPESPQSGAQAVFDATLVDEMIALMGAEATGEIASSLELEGSENISGLKAAVSAGDAPAAEREAHMLASSCLSLGLKSAGTLLRQVEADIRQGNLPTEAAVGSAEGFFFDGLTSLRSHLLNAISNPDA
jgi:signal transduction histidine kinase/CheY-like chemotaxis protein/HPt (histidine-containing phosphotransfer) domain-containing protein